jgi:gamma-glutamylcyclotransferase (GGCT)/AIG2-like uncharacterized protein YtfP
MRVFVYGTLLQRESNHRVIAPYLDTVEPGTIRGTLYDYGPFPFLVITSTGTVYGEWMTIKAGMERQALASLDRLEGYREDEKNNLYDRVTVTDLKHPAIEGYVYTYPDDGEHINIRQFPVIVQGNWRRRHEPVYFAYGSCMNEEDFHRTCPNSAMLSKGLLPGYELRFNGYSASRQGGVANIERNDGKQVEGVLWGVSESDIKALDKREGHPYFYRRVKGKVRVKHGYAKVFTYQLVVGDETDFPPSPSYLEIILDAPVSKKYKESLAQNWAFA